MFTINRQDNRIKPVKVKGFFSQRTRIPAKNLQPVLSGFKLDCNIPAMPMTCLQVTHKSSGFFV